MSAEMRSCEFTVAFATDEGCVQGAVDGEQVVLARVLGEVNEDRKHAIIMALRELIIVCLQAELPQ